MRDLYSIRELYGIWLHFCDDPDEVSILSDFSLLPPRRAAALSAEFHTWRESDRLSYADRGKHRKRFE